MLGHKVGDFMYLVEGLNGIRPYIKYLLDMLGHKAGDFMSLRRILAMDLNYGRTSLIH